MGVCTGMRDVVATMGVGVGDKAIDGDGSAGKDLGDVKRFLNRILGLTVARQNHLFAYFTAVLGAEVRYDTTISM